MFWNHLKENKNKKRYSPNFKVLFGRFVVEDSEEKKKVLSNVGVVSEQDLVGWPTTSGSRIRDLGWIFEIAGRIWLKGYRLLTPALVAFAGFSKKGAQARGQKFEKVDNNYMRKMMTKKMKIKKKRFSLRFSPFFCPDLGEDQKKKKVFTQIQSVFLPKFQRGGACSSVARGCGRGAIAPPLACQPKCRIRKIPRF